MLPSHRFLVSRRLPMQSHIRSSPRRASSTKTTSALPSLPRLPVPDLHATLRAYLTSLEPFLLEDEARGGQDFKTAYNTRLNLVDDFELNIGRRCQKRLLGTSPRPFSSRHQA